MAKEIDKIIQSKTAPKSNNVLWDDGENLKINRNGKWENTGTPMINITYANLVELRNNNKLIPGMQYRITDYVTTTAQENTRSAGHPFDVIVTADSVDKLNEVARTGFPTFNIERYKLGFSHSWQEGMNYIGLYEHNGLTYYQYQSTSEDVQMLVAFSEEVGIMGITDDPMTQRFPYVITPSYTRMYNNDVWGEWEHGVDLGEVIAFESNPNSQYFHEVGANLAAWQIWYCLDNDAERFAWADADNGKGVIYRMIDEWNNDCPYDFKNIQFKRGVYDGGGIAPDGDEDMHYYLFTFSFRTEDNEIIDTSVFGNKELLNDEGQITGVYGNVIGQYMAYDGSIDIPTKTAQRLNDIVFYSHYDYEDGLYYGCHSNSFGNNCHSNSFGNSCHSNSFGNNCDSNSFGNSCHSNSFGNSCHSNSFGKSCFANSFGDDCNGVELSHSTRHNTASADSKGVTKVFNLADLADLLNQ